MSLSDTRTRLIARLRRRKARAREGAALVEGPRAVRAALQAGVPLRFAVVAPRLHALDGDLVAALAAATDVVSVSDDELATLADTEAPQGVLAVVPEPSDAWFDTLDAKARILLLDAVQDPGNVGTLIRGAAAFALDGVVLLDGSADPWNPKAIRASAGAVFRCPVARIDVERALDRAALAGIPLLVADAAGADLREGRGRDGRGGGEGWALVVGSEGAGVRRAVAVAAAATVRVPMPGGVESLNAAVAGSILLYELTRHDGGDGV